MATISIDYDSKGDVELFLQTKVNTPISEAAQQALPSSEQEEPAKYSFGPLGVKVKAFRLRVSSHKLISSSHYFQAMLESSGFQEAKDWLPEYSREVAFQKIEQVIDAFKGRLLDSKSQEARALDLPEETMVRCMIFGFATLWSQDLELGAFALPDHAGSSILSYGSSRQATKGKSLDLQKELQNAISQMKMDDWGLDYDDFKEAPVNNRSSMNPEGQNNTPVSSAHALEVPEKDS